MKKVLLIVFLLVFVTGCNSNDNELSESEMKLFESFLGKYKISYDNDLVSNELSNYVFKDEIDLGRKCYSTDAGSTPEEEVVIENCIDAIDFETILSYDHYALLYKIDNNKVVLSIYFNYIAEPKNYELGWSGGYRMHRLCFTNDSEDKLIQSDCVVRKNGYSSNDHGEVLDTKYKFTLTKIK